MLLTCESCICKCLTEAIEGFLFFVGIASCAVLGKLVVLGLLLSDLVLEPLEAFHGLLGFVVALIHGGYLGIGILGLVAFLYVFIASLDILYG